MSTNIVISCKSTPFSAAKPSRPAALPNLIDLKSSYILCTKKKTEHKDKEEVKNIKRRKRKKCGSHYVIHSIERYNLFKLFSLYIFFVIE